jgi:MerR family copper efflux transcriptional regulator
MSDTFVPLSRVLEPLMSTKSLRVGDLARETGKSVRALHLYEELGLLEPTDRSKGGYRLYDSESVTRVRFIAKLQDMGFSLTDIAEIVKQWAASHSAPSAMERLRALYTEKLSETRAQIARLTQLELELNESLEYLGTCTSCDPKRVVHSCSKCDVHDCSHPAPDLVSGLTV